MSHWRSSLARLKCTCGCHHSRCYIGTDSHFTTSGHTETWHIGLHLPGELEQGLTLPKIGNFNQCHKYLNFFCRGRQQQVFITASRTEHSSNFGSFGAASFSLLAFVWHLHRLFWQQKNIALLPQAIALRWAKGAMLIWMSPHMVCSMREIDFLAQCCLRPYADVFIFQKISSGTHKVS